MIGHFHQHALHPLYQKKSSDKTTKKSYLGNHNKKRKEKVELHFELNDSIKNWKE